MYCAANKFHNVWLAIAQSAYRALKTTIHRARYANYAAHPCKNASHAKAQLSARNANLSTTLIRLFIAVLLVALSTSIAHCVQPKMCVMNAYLLRFCVKISASYAISLLGSARLVIPTVKFARFVQMAM